MLRAYKNYLIKAGVDVEKIAFPKLPDKVEDDKVSQPLVVKREDGTAHTAELLAQMKDKVKTHEKKAEVKDLNRAGARVKFAMPGEPKVKATDGVHVDRTPPAVASPDALFGGRARRGALAQPLQGIPEVKAKALPSAASALSPAKAAAPFSGDGKARAKIASSGLVLLGKPKAVAVADSADTDAAQSAP